MGAVRFLPRDRKTSENGLKAPFPLLLQGAKVVVGTGFEPV